MDVGALVEGFSRLLTPLIGPHLALVVRSARGLPLVRVDPTQCEQVVMNLAVNARDAMPGGGRLIIETAHDERDGQPVVRLSVRDSGRGMSADVQARIFEPFGGRSHHAVHRRPPAASRARHTSAGLTASTRTAQTLNSGIPADGSSAGFVSRLAAASR